MIIYTHVPCNFAGQVLHWRAWVPRATIRPSWSKVSSAPPATPPTRCARMWNCGKSATTCCSGCPRLTTRFVDTHPCLLPSLPPCHAFRLIGRFCSGCPRLTTRFVDTHPCLLPSLPPCHAFRLIGRFYIALFSTSEQTHSTLFSVRRRVQHIFLNNHQSSVHRVYTPSIAFRHLPPNSARFSYATEGALFITMQLSTDAVNTLQMVRVLIRLLKQPSAKACT